MDQFMELILFIVPAYVANSFPVVVGGGAPLDFNLAFSDGRRVLGNGKTIRGFVGGVCAGIITGALISIYVPLPFFADSKSQFFAAAMLSFGTLAGDAIGSFGKRRFGIGQGKPFLLDSIIFVLAAILFASPFILPGLYTIFNLAFVFGLTIILHPLMNWIANRAGLKNVPW